METSCINTFFIKASAFLLGIVFCMGATTAFAQPFELDGNAVEQGAIPGTDWDVVNAPGDSGVTEAETGLIVDLPEPDEAQYHGGGSKDQQDIPNWGWRTGSPPDKDDITNAYAAAVVDDGGHFVLVFGMDRHDTSGDAQLGFWFFQDEVGPIPDGNNGTWDGVHQIGDVLVLVNFTGGGSIPSIEVFMWDGTTAVQIEPTDNALCTGGWIPAGKDFCGITNGEVLAPWPYVNKDVGPTNMFPPGAFFEGAVDLTALGIEACFTSFLAESRSSQSITAVLKDFAHGGFPVCSISVSKVCSNPRLNLAQDMIIYDITGKVTNDGFGTVHNVSLSDSPPADGAFQEVDCVTGAPGNFFPLASLSDEACYLNTITVPLAQNGLSDTVTATANTAADGSGTVLTDQVTADCPNLPISPAIEVSKDCVSSVEVIINQVVAKVTVSGQVCNVGDTNLSNVTVADLNLVTTPAPLVNGIFLATPADPNNPTVAEGACAEYSGTYVPSEANDAMGNPTTCPSEVVFKDTVEATATDIFGAPVTPHTDMADCPLCPAGGCPAE